MRLILLRHAKSDWASAGLTDHQRPLNARGRDAAPRVARRLVELGWRPEVVWSSDSARTCETWALMAAALGAPPAHFSPQLYLAEAETLFEYTARLAPGVQTALILGHNPGISEAISLAAGVGLELQTANAALLSTDAPSWRAAGPGAWRLDEVVRARALG